MMTLRRDDDIEQPRDDDDEIRAQVCGIKIEVLIHTSISQTISSLYVKDTVFLTFTTH